MTEEIWKPVKGYEGYYEVSNFGRVKSIERYVMQGKTLRHVKEKIKKQVLKHGYPCIGLSKNRITKPIPVHILIANAFIPNPENKPYIDHINTDTMDYRIENLRWVTPKENSNNPITKIKCNTNSHSELALAKSKKTKILKGGKTSPKKVYQFTLDGVFLAEFESARDAHRTTGVDFNSINKNCRNIRSSAGGFLWSRTNNPPVFYPKSKPSKPILQFDKDMNLIKEWTSLMEAARSLGLQESNISRVAHGDKRRKTCGGFIWMYKTI